MKNVDSIIVTKALLNPVGILAASRMLAIARRGGLSTLPDGVREKVVLASYSAEFREGAREGEVVDIIDVEAAEGTFPGDSAFTILFSKRTETNGRVGKWSVTFSKRKDIRPLPYSISQSVADGLTNHELWQSEPIIATGNDHKNAQLLLWPIGQSARAYMKRLDLEFAIEPHVIIADMVEKRIYAGVAVTTNIAHWSRKGQTLVCALHSQGSLKDQPNQSKRTEFHGVLVALEENETFLIGTCRFSVSRLNQSGTPVYTDGTTER